MFASIVVKFKAHFFDSKFDDSTTSDKLPLTEYKTTRNKAWVLQVHVYAPVKNLYSTEKEKYLVGQFQQLKWLRSALLYSKSRDIQMAFSEPEMTVRKVNYLVPECESFIPCGAY